MPSIAEIRQQFPMYSDVPDGELVRGLHNKFYSDIPYADFLKKIDFRQAVNPTEGMSNTEKSLAGAGKAYVDLGRGVKQIVSSDAPTMQGLITGDQRSKVQQEVDEAKSLDAPLMRTGAGVAGNLGGNLALALPTAAIPGANTYTGAALIGAGMNALQPTASGESRLFNMGAGAVGGAAGQLAGNLVGRIAQPVASRLTPEEQKLADAAVRNNIPLSSGQVTGSKPLQITESVLENLPFTSGASIAQKDAQKQAFNRAVLAKAGIADDTATATTLGAQKSALGKQFEDIAGRNVLDFNKPVNGQPLVDKLSSIATNASRKLTPDKSQGVKNVVDDILSQVDQKGVMPGTNYQGWRTDLRLLGKGDDYEASVYQGIKKALDTTFKDQISGADSAAWNQASREYGNLKIILDAMGGAGAGTKVGNISPAQLESALTKSIGREGKALGRGDLNELSAVGRKYVGESIPDSGTAQRMLYQALLTGGGGGLGAGAALATGHDPLQGLAYGAGATGASLLLPKLVQSLIQNQPVKNYIARQAGSTSAAALRKALTNSGRTLGLAALPSVQQQPLQ